MTASLRERRRQMLQEEILGAARSLLAEKGYGAMSMDELAAHVGISKPTLYSHFETKDDLVIAAVVREIQRLVALVQESALDQKPLQRLVLLLRTIVQLQAQEGAATLRPSTPELLQLLLNNPQAVGYLQQIDNTIVSLVRESITAGQIDPTLDPDAVVCAFYGLVHGLHCRPSALPISADPEVVADTIAAIFQRGLQPPPALD